MLLTCLNVLALYDNLLRLMERDLATGHTFCNMYAYPTSPTPRRCHALLAPTSKYPPAALTPSGSYPAWFLAAGLQLRFRLSRCLPVPLPQPILGPARPQLSTDRPLGSPAHLAGCPCQPGSNSNIRQVQAPQAAAAGGKHYIMRPAQQLAAGGRHRDAVCCAAAGGPAGGAGGGAG
jgi:hypothetical protein